MTSNGILCFYENTPTGCLKPECTFIHSRPRVNLRDSPTIRRKKISFEYYLFIYRFIASSTNLVKNDATKPVPTGVSPSTSVTESNANPSQSTNSSFFFLFKFHFKAILHIDETPSVIPNTTNESPLKSDVSAPTVKTETITRRIAVSSSDTEPSNEKKNSSDAQTNNSSLSKSTTRSIITDSPKPNQEEIQPPSPITTNQSRLVVNRNVVIGESTRVPTRKIVQTTPSSNRVVVSSDSIISSTKGKKNNTDSIEQENETKKFKSNSQPSK